MKRILSIVRREMTSYANSPAAYIFVLFFLVFCSVWFFFVRNFFARGDVSLREFFAVMPAVFTILVPALTMRLWAEEKRQGTYELLATMPFSEGELVAGKFMATMTLIAMATALTLPVPLLVSMFGQIDPGQVAGEYLGVLFMAAACASVGQFVSSAAGNQISAFIFTALALLCLTLLNQLNVWLSLPAPVANALNYASINFHFESFVSGVVDTRDVGYFSLLSVLFLYLTAKELKMRKWR
ncbi:MAG: ABC transporter permease [Spirochaetes bacterium]|nr:ABC transporter permease [Spirochaetota bacterium]